MEEAGRASETAADETRSAIDPPDTDPDAGKWPVRVRVVVLLVAAVAAWGIVLLVWRYWR